MGKHGAHDFMELYYARPGTLKVVFLSLIQHFKLPVTGALGEPCSGAEFRHSSHAPEAGVRVSARVAHRTVSKYIVDAKTCDADSPDAVCF